MKEFSFDEANFRSSKNIGFQKDQSFERKWKLSRKSQGNKEMQERFLEKSQTFSLEKIKFPSNLQDKDFYLSILILRFFMNESSKQWLIN